MARAISSVATLVYAERVSSEQPPKRRGRPPGASREDVLRTATEHHLAGQRIDLRRIATELGVGRATIYRWYGSREKLVGAALLVIAERVVADARRSARGSGAERLVDTFDAINRELAESPTLRRFLREERAAALRIITSSAGPVQPRIVELIQEIIDQEVSRGRYEPPVDTTTLAYAIVRLAEAFLFNDAVADIRGDVDRLRAVEAALLGARAAGAGVVYDFAAASSRRA
ncbi:MAG: TetR/AcrR family transcriptional regulator [Actinobacteria bacterium]|nr:MAG: TetR/AcrR family transcriptional regulator [Actinomycetota bacterium]